MAEPAWVLRARRMRVRRSRFRGGIVSRFVLTSQIILWLQNTWIGRLVVWLVQPFARLFVTPRAQLATKAASAARALLDGQIAPPSQEPSPPPRQQVRFRFPSIGISSIPMRIAAHIVIILVAFSVFFTDASPQAGILQLDMAPQTLADSVVTSDRQVRWIAPNEALVRESTLQQPALRAPLASFEPAYVMSHTVQEGELLGEIANRYRVSVSTLFWSNNLDNGNILAAGQELRIPRLSGVPYVIAPDDTLDSIAERFQVDPNAIVLLRANGVSPDQPLPVGTEIFIPEGVQSYPEDVLESYGSDQAVAEMRAVAAGVVQDSETNVRSGPGRVYPRLGYLAAGQRLELIARHEDWVQLNAGSLGIGWVRADLIGLDDEALSRLEETNDFPPPPPVWVWPARGSFTSSFGWRSVPFRSFHDGIDIANKAGTHIYAARSGRVFEAGWCSGFGYCVKIDHGDGVTTIYGHMLKKPVVVAGDVVEVGQHIGHMGSTFDRSGGGYSTGVHLHFTVKVNGKAVNPLNYLP